MPSLDLNLHLTPGQLLNYYRGYSRSVQARSTSGQLVQFPAAALQRHVTPEGVHGRFRIEFDANFKFVGLEQVND